MKISQIIKDYFCLPFFLLIILWQLYTVAQINFGDLTLYLTHSMLLNITLKRRLNSRPKIMQKRWAVAIKKLSK